MNKLILWFVFMFLSFVSFSQKVYFVYLQTEQEEPFFVKMNEKVYSSTAAGYLILPNLRDSSYSFSVGFPQNKWPEQRFEVALKAKDHGYVVKNFGEKGWGLFDLQTLSVQMSAATTPKTSLKTEKTEVSAFTEILSRAADDSTLRERPVLAKQEEPKVIVEKVEETVVKTEEKKPAAEVIKEETVAVPEKTVTPVAEIKAIANTETATKATEQAKTEIPESPKPAVITPVTAEYKKSVVVVKSEYSSAEGTGIVYIDEQANGVKDTINILIPSPQPAVEKPVAAREEKKFLDISSDTVKAETKPVATETKEVVVDIKATEETKPVVAEVKTTETAKPVTTEVKTAERAKPVVKNSCKDVAVEADFLKLRKKMAAEIDDDDMVDEARKYFKTKCFTTGQIRNLGALFLDDLGKYKFFDMAYIFVADAENFPSLQSELKGEYYITRFKAMLR
jgi:hypothetical protein